jgi:parallel beta-helix repeat protein
MGISVVNASDVEISDSAVTNNGHVGINIEPQGTEVVTGVTVSGCRLEHNGVGLQAYATERTVGGGLGTVSSLLFRHNSVLGSGASGVRIGRVNGVRVEGNLISDSGAYGILVDQGSMAVPTTDHKISENIIARSTSGGVQLLGLQGHPLQDIDLSRNVIQCNAHFGVNLEKVAGSRVAGNTITRSHRACEPDVEPAGDALPGLNIIGAESVGNEVFANVIHDNRGVGVNLTTSSASTALTENVVSDNGYLSDDGDAGVSGVRINNSSSNIVRSNRVWNNRRFGVEITSSASSSNTVSNNVLTDGGADAPLSNQGTSTTLSGNVP